MINTELYSQRLRGKSIDLATGKILISQLKGSGQEPDLTQPTNCGGYGRLRHFRRNNPPGWPDNPLPIDPACWKLNLSKNDSLLAQVFQNAACNWRCWYCFVPFELLNASLDRSAFLSPAELLDKMEEGTDARVIDLSGGQPDLTPEWVLWFMRELKARNMTESYYLWSDDNLSTDFFWRYLSPAEIDEIVGYRNYGKVCCFKGFDAGSFAFNTKAHPAAFLRQFELFKEYTKLGIDVYAYATFTSNNSTEISKKMAEFVDRLQSVSQNLPLRLVPLQVRPFTPVISRMGAEHTLALKTQEEAVAAWQTELAKRFTEAQRKLPIYDVKL